MIVFLAISGWLARYLSNENAERNQIVALLEAQTAGDARAMLGDLPGCAATPSCAAVVRVNASTLQGRGSVKILALSSPTAYALTDSEGQTRVAWKQGARLPVVQCVLVRRRGSAITGLRVTLRRIGAPIAGTADCPS
ncbi:MAG: hypothetical protein KGJ43_08640 [Acidobacteriota bacterium]|nr:hypothetical protein [Acidobacteriota bacterium]